MLAARHDDDKCLCVSAVAHVYIYTYVCVYTVTYLHILPLYVGGKGWDERRECEKRKSG